MAVRCVSVCALFVLFYFGFLISIQCTTTSATPATHTTTTTTAVFILWYTLLPSGG